MEGKGKPLTCVDQFRLLWTPFLKKVGPAMQQAVGIVCPKDLGSGGELTLWVGDTKKVSLPTELLADAEQFGVYYWLIPQPKKPVRLRAMWRTPLNRVYKATLTLQPARPSNVRVIFKTHLDIGYTHRIDQVLDLYAGPYMDKLLDHLDRTSGRKPGKQYVWTFSAWLLEKLLEEGRLKNEHRKKLEAYIKAGRVVWTMAPFTTHSEFFGQEEMNRSLYIARRLADRYKQPIPTAAKMTDVPAHPAALAMTLASAGGKFFQVGINDFSIPPRVPPLFRWELPDEQKLLVHYVGNYGTSLLPPADWPWDEWLAVQMSYDNEGPGDLSALKKLDWIESHFDQPKYTIGRLEDFAEAIVRKHDKELPVVQCTELTDWWAYGIASQAMVTARARREKDHLPSVEMLNTFNALTGGSEVPPATRDKIEQAYGQLALYTEHTWGDHASDARKTLPKGNLYANAALVGQNPPEPIGRWTASWQDKAAFAERASALADEVESQAFKPFAIGAGRSAHCAVVLFNALSWPRGGRVCVSDKGLPAEPFDLVDPTSGAIIVYERKGGRLEFIAPPVPPCGYLALQVRPVVQPTRPGRFADWQQATKTLHTNSFSLMFHEVGGLARWHDRQRSCQWCSTDVERPLGSYLYEMPGGEQLQEFARRALSNQTPWVRDVYTRAEYAEMKQFGPAPAGRAKFSTDLNSLYSQVILEGAIPARKVAGRRSGDARRYRTTFTHYRDTRELYVRLSLYGKQPTYGVEAGYMYFPFAGERPTVMIDRITQTLLPDDELIDNCNAAQMITHHGLRVENNFAGLNFYPLDTPLIGFGRPGLWRFDDDGDYETGELYAMLFNNGWGTNFAQWQGGDLSYEFVMQPTGNDDWDGGLAKGGAEHHRPLLAAVVPDFRAEAARSLLRIEPDKVQLVALKPAEFDRGYILRLWNAEPDDVKATLRFDARRASELYVCDLLERRGKRISIDQHGVAKLPIRTNEMMTLWFKPKG